VKTVFYVFRNVLYLNYLSIFLFCKEKTKNKNFNRESLYVGNLHRRQLNTIESHLSLRDSLISYERRLMKQMSLIQIISYKLNWNFLI
jgi:hypothetical protein